eukprot:GHVQ01026206.1.p1 GENE.GHVQ01026206.1~~GHVQ01026206.1.p1  ORF type:complete len:327 (+),score=58.23 GHVQ01026206.1:800-1780(+)
MQGLLRLATAVCGEGGVRQLSGTCLGGVGSTHEGVTQLDVGGVAAGPWKPQIRAERTKPRRPLTIEEALYLSKAAGVYTRKEIQTQIMSSPSFSPDASPFLIENFFDTGEAEPPLEAGETSGTRWQASSTGYSARSLGQRTAEEEDGGVSTEEDDDTERVEGVARGGEEANAVISRTIAQVFNPQWNKTFWLNGREWLVQADGTGTRKRATAHVVIRRGSGQVVVNDGQHLYWRWPYYYNRMDVLQPFYLTGTAGEFDLFIHTVGGGVSGQSGATRLAVGRALAAACPSCAEDMAEDLVLYEDTRQRLPKMPGRTKSRAARQWSKR